MTESFAFYVSVLRKYFTQYCTEKLAEINVTYGQLFILIFVGKKETCSPKEISLALKLDAGHLNRTLSKLIENGLLKQKKSSKDKRANIISLTPKGREAFEMSHNLFWEWDSVILNPLSDNEKQNLMELMKKIAFSEDGRF